MKKKLLAILLASAATVSLAEVTLYGTVVAGVEYDTFGSGIKGAGSFQDYGSKFGIKGKNSLYQDTALIWQIEQFIDLNAGQSYELDSGDNMIVPNSTTGVSGRITTSVNTLAGGTSFIGVDTKWGQVRVGNLSNYLNENMWNVDVFHCSNGVNCMVNYSRTPKRMSGAIDYNSPRWHGVSVGGVYSFDTNGIGGVGNINGGNNIGGGTNGLYGNGIYSLGANWQYSHFNVAIGTMIWPSVGNYQGSIPDSSSINNVAVPAASSYKNAYEDRLEISYDDPEGLLAGVGYQITDGLGWSGWANSGGSFHNYTTNKGYNKSGLDSAEYQTQEIALDLGWHFGAWTPKVGYVYGNDLMYGSSFGSLLMGKGNKIKDTGYQNIMAELDWQMNPRTYMWLGFGYVKYGQTLHNISYCGINCGANKKPDDASNPVTKDNQAAVDQTSYSLGIAHSF